MAQMPQHWSLKDTETLIRWRMAHGYLFSGWRNTCRNGWEMFIKETQSDLDGNITAPRAKKKWENLKCKYSDTKEDILKNVANWDPFTCFVNHCSFINFLQNILFCVLQKKGIQVLKALAKDVDTVKPDSWRWFRLMETAVDGEPDEIESPKPSLLSNLVDESESECAAQPSKKMYQVEMGSDILELLTHSVIEVNTQEIVTDGVTLSEPAEPVQVRPVESIRTPPERQDELHTERAKLKRERQLLEKEHADLDRERILLERERCVAAREKATLERDRAQLEKDRAAIDRERASLEQVRARLERDRVALERDRETFTAMTLETNGHIQPDSPYVEDRKRLISLFEKLIDRF